MSRMKLGKALICYNKIMGALRTEKMEQKYKKFRAEGFLADGCNLCNRAKSIKKFKYWRVVNNLFPYNRIAKVNHIIIPKRHVTYEKLNGVEKKEFNLIKSTYIEKEYQLIMEATNKRKSIPEHFHIQLIVLKK